MNIAIGQNLIYRKDKFDHHRKAVVLDLQFNPHSLPGIFAVKIKTVSHPFWVRTDQLEPLPVEPRSADPLGLSAAERRVFDIVLRHQPIAAADIARIASGDPLQNPWTAGVAGALVKRLVGLGRLKKGEGKPCMVEVA